VTPIDKILAAAARLAQHAGASQDRETKLLCAEAAAVIRGAIASLKREAEQEAIKGPWQKV
jgi:hypothetical protein